MKIFKKINYSIAGLAVLMLFFTSCEEEVEALDTNYITFEKDRTLILLK